MQKEPVTTQRTTITSTHVPSFEPRKRFIRNFLFFFGVVTQTYVWDIFLARFSFIRWYVQKTAMQRWIRIARRFRKLAVESGGMQIKLGQFLSSRADLIPDPVRHELAGLQDEVPAAPASHVLTLIQQEYGKTPDELFKTFDQLSVAAASLGQVHYAVLHNGNDVAVKVQRPHIEDIIDVDLKALRWIIRIIRNHPFVQKRANAQSLYNEFSRVLLRELDYVQEAENAEIIRANFKGVPGVYIPYPIKELTTRRVLVMERIGGIKISDRAALDAAGINRHQLADRLNQTYLKQLFIDGFFHADPHPGNLFVRPETTATLTNNLEAAGIVPLASTNSALEATGTPFTLIFVDFGMVSDLPPKTMEIVLSGILGLATNDAERITDALYELKMFLPGVDKRPIVQALRVMLHHTYNRSVRELTNIDIEQMFEETHDLVYDLPFQVPQNLLFLGRAISMVAGLATEIDPSINLFKSLYPFAQEMLDREQQNENWLERIPLEIAEVGDMLSKMPRQMSEFFSLANNGELQTKADFGRLERILRRVERSSNRMNTSVLVMGLFLGGVQMRLRGLNKEATRAWWAAAALLVWSGIKQPSDRDINGNRS